VRETEPINQSDSAAVLAAYANRFGDLSPSNVSEEGTQQLMLDALWRGTRIVALDVGSPPQDLVPG